MPRSPVRPTAKEFLVYSADVSRGWQVIRSTSFLAGERKVDLGVFLRIFDETGRHVGYQPTQSRPVDQDVKPQRTQAALSLHDMKAVAGVRGSSRTAGLLEEKRLERVKRGLLPEDAIERSIEKVKIYTHPAPGRGDRAVRVYPKEATR